MKAFFRISQLKQKYGDFHLGPLSLVLSAHDYLVILGPTGSGKSSLLHALAGTRGTIAESIYLEERDIGVLPPHLRGIGYVTQDNTLFPHYTVGQNIAFPLEFLSLTTAEKEKQVHRLLDLFGLRDKKEQNSSTLSGGEQRKVAIARSLASNPRLMLLDEPLSMLDHNGRQDILATLKMIHQELKTTTVHVTHDRLEAWSIADQCAVMHQGRLLQTGNVSEVFRKSANLEVAEFLGGTNICEAAFSKKTVTCAWGKFPLPQTVPWQTGYVMLRPELIDLSTGPAKAKAKGRIRAIRDFGQYVECTIALSTHGSVAAHVPIHHAAMVKMNAQVYLHWSDNALHPFQGGI